MDLQSWTYIYFVLCQGLRQSHPVHKHLRVSGHRFHERLRVYCIKRFRSTVESDVTAFPRAMCPRDIEYIGKSEDRKRLFRSNKREHSFINKVEHGSIVKKMRSVNLQRSRQILYRGLEIGGGLSPIFIGTVEPPCAAHLHVSYFGEHNNVAALSEVWAEFPNQDLVRLREGLKAHPVEMWAVVLYCQLHVFDSCFVSVIQV